MADEEHVALLKQGVEAWNAWRRENPDIRPNLIMANLSGERLMRASLSRAELGGANLSGVDLSMADLTGANLRLARLFGANLTGADLRGADLGRAGLSETVFVNVNLTDTEGLKKCRHGGPSGIDHRTLQQSGPLPQVFLRGVGLPDNLIDYLPSLLNQP